MINFTVHSLRFILLSFLFAALLSSCAKNQKRSQLANCSWKTFVSKEHSVRLKYNKCVDEKNSFDLHVVGHIIERRRPASTSIRDNDVILEIFKKPKNVKIEKHIEDTFISKISENSKKYCKVVKLKTSNPKAVQRFVIDATEYTTTLRGSEQLAIHSTTENIEDTICGRYTDIGKGYFEYRPLDSSEKFAYVSIAHNNVYVDLDSLRFK